MTPHDLLPIGLYFSRDDLPALREKVRSGPPARMAGRLIEMCEGYVASFEPEADFEGMERTRTTKDLMCWEPHLSYARRNADRLQKLALAHLLTDRAEFADLGRRVMLVNARHGEWHQYYRAFGTIECGEICKGMATGYDWLHHALSDAERRTVEEAMAEKGGRDLAGSLTGIAPGLTPEGGRRFGQNNFGLVMTGGLGLIGLALEGRHPEAGGWVDLAASYMEESIRRQYDVDGGIVEAARYWNYSTPFVLFLAEPLRRLKGRDLYGIEAFSRTVDFPIYNHSSIADGPYGTANFADTFFREPATHACVLLRFASHYRRGDYQHFYEKWFREEPAIHGHHDLVHSILWYDPTVRPEAPGLGLVKRFRTLEWVFVRSGWETGATQFAFKGGPYLGGHNHLDRNSFILEAFGERLAVDSGSGPYYTDIQRTYYTQSVGHNVLLINGEGQKAGGARMTACEADDERCYVASDASEVYPQARSVAREALSLDRASLFVVRDRVVADEPPLVDWLLHTMGEVRVEGDSLVCACEKADLFVWFVAPGPAWDRIDPTPVRHQVERGRVDAEEGVGQIVRLSNVPMDKAYEFLAVLAPVQKGATFPEVRIDGNTIRVAWKGKDYRIDREQGRLSARSE